MIYIPCRMIYPCREDDGTEAAHSVLLTRDDERISLGYCATHADAMEAAKRLGYFPMQWNTRDDGTWYCTSVGHGPRRGAP